VGVATHHAGLGVAVGAGQAEGLEQADGADRQRPPAPRLADAQVDLEAAAADVEDAPRRDRRPERVDDGLAHQARLLLAVDDLELDPASW
jgi:hypothetical protein